MERRIVKTGDGSSTIRIDAWDEAYHSMHGAVAESKHVFIEHGLFHLNRKKLSILEMGFGTGLNALLTLIEASKSGMSIDYTGLEAFPLKPAEWDALHYTSLLSAAEFEVLFKEMHQSQWEVPVKLTPYFSLTKKCTDMATFYKDEGFDLVYFDAFGYRVQPELWSEAIFDHMYQSLKPGGILVTYAAKGLVRRRMQQSGFTVERLPGPPGKREMLRATKITASPSQPSS